MEYRKIIKFGTGSYVVSLPKAWVTNNKLKQGNLVYLSEKDNDLVLTSNSEVKREPKEITIEVDNKSFSRVETEIVTAYLASYNVIRIQGESLKINAPKIKDILYNLAGLEIIEQTDEKIVVKDLLNLDEISIKTMVRRIDIILRAMIDDTLESIKGENHYESIFHRDKDVNRLVHLTHRSIRLALNYPSIEKKFSYTDLLTDYLLVGFLEAIGDSAKRISRILKNAKLEKKALDELEDIYSTMRQRYLDVMKAYHTNDKNFGYELEQESKKRIGICEKYEKKHPECLEIVHNLKGMSSAIKHITRGIITNQ